MDVNVGRDTRALAAGDFNHDGHLDLAAISDEYVTILLGSGDGRFQISSGYPLKHATVSRCYSRSPESNTFNIIAADLNKDRNLDLVVPNEFGFISILLGNSDGTFRDGGNFDGACCALNVAAADLNRDGKLDLVVTNYYNAMSITTLQGNGDGTFQPHIEYPAAIGARGVAVADLNGDGTLDIAVGNQFVDTISIFLQR
jgi:FG-GAP-like repeat